MSAGGRWSPAALIPRTQGKGTAKRCPHFLTDCCSDNSILFGGRHKAQLFLGWRERLELHEDARASPATFLDDYLTFIVTCCSRCGVSACPAPFPRSNYRHSLSTPLSKISLSTELSEAPALWNGLWKGRECSSGAWSVIVAGTSIGRCMQGAIQCGVQYTNNDVN